MKKLLFILVLLCVSMLYAFSTASSIPFAGSYMQRATGVDAIYWNPANLSNLPTRAEITVLPISYKVYNNALSIDLYNEMMVDTLSQDLKDKFLSEMNGNLNINMEMNTILFGYATRSFGLSFGTFVNTYAKLDEHYLDLILNGNEYERDYFFTKSNNDASFLAMQDITVAFGGYELNKALPDVMNFLPSTRYGFAISFLSGASGNIDKFDGLFKASDDGLNLDQQVTLHYGGGFGYKGMFGLSSDLISTKNQTLSAGLTLDNLFGTFNNSISCKAHEANLTAQNVYIVHLNEDFFAEQDTSYSIANFSTDLPLKLSGGLLYKIGNLSASLDFSKYSKESAFGSDLADTSVGIEYELLGFIPLQGGYLFGNDSHPSVSAFGVGLRYKYWDGGLGFQFYDSFGGQSSKGLSFSAQMAFRY
ncbi:MAG TPA: hypothetical protein PLV22_04385 [Candidatus Cloacimonadota bacterium]|nr:hypothetical protein [Candidatus Cloacimonadota bacterium]